MPLFAAIVANVFIMDIIMVNEASDDGGPHDGLCAS